MSDRALGRQFEPQQVPAHQIQVGDRLSHRSRVHRIHTHNGKILVATKVQGSTARGVHSYEPEELVTVYRAVK